MSQSKAELVYVSTVNSTHAVWTKEALKRGFHVIVDKPAFISLEDTRQLVDLARRYNRCLAEATVYAYHPQIHLAQNAFARVNSRPRHITATFSFPPLDADNFRYKKKLGGGALWDLGPYAITPGRIFFREEPQEIFCRIGEQGAEVETCFSILAAYSGGRSMVGYFGFNTSYKNKIEILGPHTTVSINRVFTTPANMENTLFINQNNQTTEMKTPPSDSFINFLRVVFRAIETGRHEPLAQNILSDATVLHRLRQASSQ
jgi:predicted dehydrogenase